MSDEPKTMVQVGDKQVDPSQTKTPESRTFREAWRLDGDVVTVDMDAARKIAQDKIRQARDPKLQRLDVEVMRAQEDRTATDELVAKKQTLRNYPADSRLTAAQDDKSLEAALNQILQEIEEA